MEANVLDSPLHCPSCQQAEVIPYTDPKLSLGDSTQELISWNGHTLNSGHYLCPRCGDMTLEFLPSGLMWD